MQAHRFYLSTIADHQRQLRNGDSTFRNELYRFLHQWWIGHMLTIDEGMGTALRALALAKGR